MIDRLILSAVLSTAGWHGLYPDPPPQPKPLTPHQLSVKAKERSISHLCTKKQKTLKVKELCERWEKH